MEIQENGTKLVKLKQKAMSNLVTVDGFSIGDMQDVVIRDRQILAADGIFLIVMAVNPRTGQLRKSPDIISRGFIYLKEERTLINEARKVIQQCTDNHSKASKTHDFDKLKSDVTDRMRKLLLQKTGKRPLVIPVLITI
jgi:ribonuclease J